MFNNTIDKFKYDLDAVIEMIHNEDRIKKQILFIMIINQKLGKIK